MMVTITEIVGFGSFGVPWVDETVCVDLQVLGFLNQYNKVKLS